MNEEEPLTSQAPTVSQSGREREREKKEKEHEMKIQLGNGSFNCAAQSRIAEQKPFFFI